MTPCTSEYEVFVERREMQRNSPQQQPYPPPSKWFSPGPPECGDGNLVERVGRSARTHRGYLWGGIASLAVALIAFTGCSDAPRNPQAAESSSSPEFPSRARPPEQVIQVVAYYFHGTVRCETCQKIEKHSKDLIHGRFADQLASQHLVFKSVDYDEPENRHFLTDYKLPCPSLVLVREERGKPREWKLLGQTWDYVHIPPQLDQYIEEEVGDFVQRAFDPTK